jgi:hypothetical protein
MELTAPRESARRCAAAAAALVLALGVAACTGDEEQPDPAPSAESTPTADGTGSASDGGGAEISDADLTAATDRFLAFLRVVDDQDWEGACGYVLDPETGTPPEGERQQACADGAREAMSAYEQLLAPGVFDSFDASMVRAEPAEDGTIALSLLEQDVDVPMVRGEDGQWYLSIPF